MKKIKDITTALVMFEDASVLQTQATEEGDYKVANKNYDIVVSIVAFLKEQNELARLQELLKHALVGPRLWAACYLLSIDEKNAVEALQNIINAGGIHSLTAKTTLNEWKKGNLRL